MKKAILFICLAWMTCASLHAETYSGQIAVTRYGQTSYENVTVTVTPTGTNLNSFVLSVPFMGNNMTLNMNDVPSATTDGITTYNAMRDVSTMLGTMRTTLFARVTDGMMAANVTIPAFSTTMWFNTVGDHFQLPNSDLEDWAASTGEPDHWHGFKSAGGTQSLVNMSASMVKLAKSDDVRNGVTGYSAVMTAGGISFLNVVANGTMTNGRLIAGSTTASDPANHAEMDKDKTDTDANGDLFYMPLYAKPDKFNVWLKYTQGTANANNKASVSVKTFDGTYYQEPEDKTYTNLSGSIVGGQITAGDWTFYSFPFDYDSYAANGANTEAIFVTFSTNGTPGSGSIGDALYVDDMELVYLGNMTDLRYKGTTIEGWNPAVTTYSMEIAGEPNLDDFTATIEGASAVVTKSMEQNADGSYRIVISVVSGDLQTATAYIINATVVNDVLPGDVDGDKIIGMDDLTALINYLLTSNSDGINMANADVDGSTTVGMDDLTALINYLLTH